MRVDPKAAGPDEPKRALVGAADTIHSDEMHSCRLVSTQLAVRT